MMLADAAILTADGIVVSQNVASLCDTAPRSGVARPGPHRHVTSRAEPEDHFAATISFAWLVWRMAPSSVG